MNEEREAFIAALQEAIELLQEEVSRYRRSNKLLRMVNRSLRQQQILAHHNDELFKELCASDANEYTNVEPLDGGLPEAEPSQASGVQPL